MTLEQILSLKTLTELKNGLKIYGINEEIDRKIDLIKKLKDIILNDDYFLLTLIRLTDKERKMIKNGLNKKIEITRNNIANIININNYLISLIDDNKLIIAEEVVKKYVLIEQDKTLIGKIKYLNYLSQITAFCSNFYGIFNLNDIYNLLILNADYKDYPLNLFSKDLIEFNDALNYFKLDNNYFISNIAVSYGIDKLKDEQQNILKYIPSLKEVNDYYTNHYLNNDTLSLFKKMALKEHNLLDTEYFIRALYSACMYSDNNDDAVSLIKTFFTFKEENSINDIAELYVYFNYKTRKISLKGHNLLEQINNEE